MLIIYITIGYIFIINICCNDRNKENEIIISDTIIFEDDFLINLNFNVPSIKNYKLIYKKKLDKTFLESYKIEDENNYKIDIYMYFRGEYFTKSEIINKDYMVYNQKKYIFDSLLLNDVNLYSQSIGIIEINKFSFNSYNYIAFYIVDTFILGANSQSYLYIFNFTSDNDLNFVGVFTSQLSISKCMGDFNKDGFLDFFQWTRHDTIGSIYSIFDNKLELNKDMYLNCIRFVDTNHIVIPAIIRNKSKFPPLNSNYNK